MLDGEPVEINPSNGIGMKVMTIDEWTFRWKARKKLVRGTLAPRCALQTKRKARLAY